MIINSLLDLDFYKILMAQVANDTFPATEVSYRFKNRTKISLKGVISGERLRKEILHVEKLKFKLEELNYLSSLGVFSKTFLNRLSNLKLSSVNIDYSGEEIEITTRGRWVESILWETIILSIVNELYYDEYIEKNGLDKKAIILKGKSLLYNKISKLVARPDIKFSDFGTRRRFSGDWQKFVVSRLKSELDSTSFLGTSNVYLAFMLGLKPIGTQAHEYFMIGTGIFDIGSNESIVESHSKMLDIWYKTYGKDKTIALSDTFGTDFFLKDFEKFAKDWNGVRHDSGDPFKFAKKIIAYYKSLGIDPRTKMIVFSDGLTVDLMIELQDMFSDKIGISFGIGTHLTNDMADEWQTLSIVMKANQLFKLGKELNLVKLSDNINKATGAVESIERYKTAFGYTNTKGQKLIV